MSETKARLEEEDNNMPAAQNSLIIEKKEIIQNEIECPRCNGIMSLCSDFDSLFYNCEECDFILYTIKKSS
jgi:hypothetical protein